MFGKAKIVFCMGVLFLLLLLCFPSRIYAEVPTMPFTVENIDVTKYTYEVTPILSPYCYFVYVRTDNPDPTSFCLCDKDSKYRSEGGSGKAIWSIFNWEDKIDRYSDVVYENESNYRVKGGYIFTTPGYYPDGGELIVQKRVKDTSTHYYYINWEKNYVDTNIKITCPAVKTIEDDLIDTYTSKSKSFFENMDAVQKALDDLAVYPRGVRDSDKPNQARPYPFLTCSPYRELGLNEWYSEMFEDGRILMSKVYPYVLDSYGFPETIANVAEQLNPDCQISSGQVHWERGVTYNGVTRYYGGAGEGGSEGVIYTRRVSKDFTFDNTSGDFFRKGTLASYREKLLAYAKTASEDIESYRDMISGPTFRNTIDSTGGTWMLVGKEGWSFDTARAYAYVIPYETPNSKLSPQEISDAWVDGRYINDWEQYEPGAHFSDHPTADIVIPKMQYTDVHGEEHRQDVLFTYDSTDDMWHAWSWRYYGSYDNVPDIFTLTREQVQSMHVDAKTDINPVRGLIYDGTVYPGTVFNNILKTDYVISASVKTIKKEAYAANSFTAVRIKSGTEKIGARAFLNCRSLCQIEIPQSVNSIADNAFEGCTEVLILCEDGSYAQQYAINHGMAYYIKEEILYGDADCNGSVNSKDRTMLSRYLANWIGYDEKTVNLDALDLNADGKVNAKDRTILSRHLAHWKGYETLPYTD